MQRNSVVEDRLPVELLIDQYEEESVDGVSSIGIQGMLTHFLLQELDDHNVDVIERTYAQLHSVFWHVKDKDLWNAVLAIERKVHVSTYQRTVWDDRLARLAERKVWHYTRNQLTELLESL